MYRIGRRRSARRQIRIPFIFSLRRYSVGCLDRFPVVWIKSAYLLVEDFANAVFSLLIYLHHDVRRSQVPMGEDHLRVIAL